MVVFAGLLTIVLLKRRLHLHHWMGIILIVAGAAIVGASRWCPVRTLAPAAVTGRSPSW